MRAAFILIVGFLMAISGCGTEQSEQAAQDTPPHTLQQPIIKSVQNEYVRHTSSVGQLIYVPVYSHIYQQDRRKTFNLTATLSFRNTDPQRSLLLSRVSYYDLDGNLVQQFLKNPTVIEPLASTSFVVEERDLRGGVGANFMVDWQSDAPVNPPVVEAVMISTSQQQGLSFLSEGRVLQEYQSEQKPNN